MIWTLILNLQRVGLSKGRENVIYWCMPLFLLFTFSLIFFLIFLLLFSFFFHFFFHVFLCFLLFLFYLLRSSPFTVYGYPFLYHLPLWDLPLLSLNRFWLLMGIPLRLPTSLPAVQPLPLPKVCWLHHSPFSDKITCLVSYLSLFFFYQYG